MNEYSFIQKPTGVEVAMAQPINRYKADLRDYKFLLFEQFNLQELLGQGPVRGLGPGRRRDGDE